MEVSVAATLLEANRLYLEAARTHLEANRIHLEASRLHLEAVRQRADRCCKRQRPMTEANAEINSVTEFLRSGHLAFNRNDYMPFEEFSKAYESYVASNCLKRLKLNGDRIGIPLLECGCKILKNAALKYPRGSHNIVTGRFIMGADICHISV
jgi:hypothetical protein